MLLTHKSEHILSNYVFSKRKSVSKPQIRIRRMRWANRVQAYLMNFGSPSNVTGSIKQKLRADSPQCVAELRNRVMQHWAEVPPPPHTCVVCASVFLVVSDYYVAYVVTPLNTNYVSQLFVRYNYIFKRKTGFIQHNIFQ